MNSEIEPSAKETPQHSPKVAYLLKVYPRFSQTFILNEILAHQSANAPVEIFSLRRPNDGRFHASLGRVQSPVRYFDQLPNDAEQFLAELHRAACHLPNAWSVLRKETDVTAATLYQALRVATEVRSLEIEHIHAHFGNVATTVARLASQLAGITYSFTAHARDIFHRNVVQSRLEQKLQGAAGIVTVSHFNLDYLRDRFGPTADKVEVVYNGLDMESFPFSTEGREERHLVAVGRLVEKKGFKDLIHACEILMKTGHPNVRCTIAGDGPLRRDLQKLISERHLDGSVRLVGSMPINEVKQLVGKATLVVAPCVVASDGDRDGLPTVLLEAMALGAPCIATPVTGIPEAIRHDETGLIAPSSDPQSLANAIACLLEDRSLRERLAKGARQLIESQFDVAKSTSVLRDRFRIWSATGTNSA